MHTREYLTATLLILLIGWASSATAQPTVGEEDTSGTSTTRLPTVGDEPKGDGDATDKEEIRKRLEFLLSGYEYFPTRETLDELAPAPLIVDLLQVMAKEDDLRPSLRLRAVDALSLYEGEKVTKFLLDLLAYNPEEVEHNQRRVIRLMRHRAINSLAKIQGTESVGALIPLLDDDDLQIRLTAISALGQFGGSAGKKALEDMREKDTHPAIHREIGKYL